MNNQTDRSTIAGKIWSGELNRETSLPLDSISLVTKIYEEVWNKGVLDLVDDFLDTDFVDYNQPPGLPDGREGYKQGVSMIRTAFPDVKFSLEQILGEDNRVAIRITGRGTHKGIFLGIQPTGKQVSLESMTFFHTKNGKIAARWGITDLPRVLQQLQGEG